MAPRAKADEGVTGEGDFTCEKCGRKFTHGAWYTKHALHCEGAPATSGRIAARSGTTAIAVAVPVSRPQVRRQKRNRMARTAHVVSARGHRTPPAATVVAIAAAATDKATEIVIAGLMAKREIIDRAIAALQAVA